jgi:metallo-beta-lactamase family protein
LVLESTYGNRLHEKGDSIEILGAIIREAIAKGGILLIPAFAVARTQTILYCLYQLKQRKEIPDVPIYLDSPAAIKATDLFCGFTNEHKLPLRICEEAFNVATYTPTAQESKKLDRMKHSASIVAGSGMANGGRIIHHFKRYISDPKNTVLFVGYQAEETNGKALVGGAEKIKIFGKTYKVRAHIKELNTFSAHADYNEILEWLGHFESPIKKVFITHGELESAISLKAKIEDRFKWPVVIPQYEQSFDLD